MAFSHLFLLCLLLSCSIPFSAEAADGPTQALIDRICRQMEEYGFCNKVFNDNLRFPSAGLITLTEITIDQVMRNSSGTYTFIVGLLREATDPAQKNALVACESAYRVVMAAFTDASRAFGRRMFDDMNKAERIAPRAQASCQITFSTPPTPLNPLVDRNRQSRILIAMAVVTGYMVSQ